MPSDVGDEPSWFELDPLSGVFLDDSIRRWVALRRQLVEQRVVELARRHRLDDPSTDPIVVLADHDRR